MIVTEFVVKCHDHTFSNLVRTTFSKVTV